MMADTESAVAGESIVDDGTTLNGDMSSMPKDDSDRKPERAKRASSIYTINSVNSVRRMSMRIVSAKDIILGSLSLLPMLPRISSARREFALVHRGSSLAPLLKQRKVLEDLLKLTRDEMPSHLRKSAIGLISYSFEYMVLQLFSGGARKVFLNTLSELCSEELPYDIREEGLKAFYYIVGASTSLGRKDFPLEHEDCRVVHNHAQTTTQVSLKLCCYAYLILGYASFADHVYQPISEAERRTICVDLSELTQAPLPTSTRKAALELLCRFESTLSCGLAADERHFVWESIFELSGCTSRNSLLQYHALQSEEIHQNNCKQAHKDAVNDCFYGLRCLWKFNLLHAWVDDMQEMHETKKKFIAADLYELATTANTVDVRRRALFAIVLFANLPHWEDMYELPKWRTVTDYFAEFCLNDSEIVDRNGVMDRVKGIFQSMLEPSDKRIITTRRELHISKHVSVVISRDTDQLLALSETIKKQCGPELHSESALENLSVFMMPGESLLIHKDQQSILYERICSYTEYEQTREIAIQAMFALLNIQEWIKASETVEAGFED